ncbi:MAG: diaminopimelate decarboxylase [Magnetococcales bacterium]|nr:diaminopimelate decarboxylase [Magnetococcales bacterium]
MDYFHYVDNQLHCEKVPLSKIAQAVGTPFYCYSEQTLQRHVRVFQEAFAPISHLICYSVKANSNLAVLDSLVKEGVGFDIVSVGELERAKRVGCPGEKIVFSGVGKRRDEIQSALDYGILMFNVESKSELLRLNGIAGEMGKKAPIAIRVNPDVDPKTHPYISTGMRTNKFGISYDQAIPLYLEAASLKNIEVLGLDCHIGSQLTSLAPFVDALKRVLTLEKELFASGIKLQYIDLGGGLGIPYEEEQVPPHPEHYAGVLLAELNNRNITLILEPGRVISGNAGILVSQVEYIKQGETKKFIITDAGMNDLLRPALYEAYHSVQPVERRFGREESVCDVVGPICESGDYSARERLLPEFQEGELLAIRSAGAYGFVMSSNYNSRPRVAEVMVRGDKFAVVRRRETIDQLMENESLFEL